MNWRIIRICKNCGGRGCAVCAHRGMDRKYRLDHVLTGAFFFGTAFMTCTFLLLAIAR